MVRLKAVLVTDIAHTVPLERRGCCDITFCFRLAQVGYWVELQPMVAGRVLARCNNHRIWNMFWGPVDYWSEL